MSGSSHTDLLVPQYQFPFYQLFPQFQAAQSIVGAKQEDRLNEDLIKHLSQLSQEQRAATTEPNLETDKLSIYE